MNTKLLTAAGIACAVSLSGCAIVTSMLTTEKEYIEKASDAMSVPMEDLKLLPESVQPGINKVTYELKDVKDGKRYRCWISGGITGGSGEASCKVRVDGGWEDVGVQQEEPEAVIQIKSPDRARTGLPGGETKLEWDRFDSQDNSTSDVFTPEQHPVLFTDSNGTATTNADPKVLGNSKFSVRDSEGHSYECHFANVGDTTSEAVSVCTKVY